MKTIKLLQLKIDGHSRIVVRNASSRKLLAVDIAGASVTVAVSPAVEIKLRSKTVRRVR